MKPLDQVISWLSVKAFPNACNLLGSEFEGTSLNTTLPRPDGHEFTWLWEHFIFNGRDNGYLKDISNWFCPSCKIHQGNHALCPIYKAVQHVGQHSPQGSGSPAQEHLKTQIFFSQRFELGCGGDDYILLWLQFFPWHDNFSLCFNVLILF